MVNITLSSSFIFIIYLIINYFTVLIIHTITWGITLLSTFSKNFVYKIHYLRITLDSPFSCAAPVPRYNLLLFPLPKPLLSIAWTCF